MPREREREREREKERKNKAPAPPLVQFQEKKKGKKERKAHRHLDHRTTQTFHVVVSSLPIQRIPSGLAPNEVCVVASVYDVVAIPTIDCILSLEAKDVVICTDCTPTDRTSFPALVGLLALSLLCAELLARGAKWRCYGSLELES